MKCRAAVFSLLFTITQYASGQDTVQVRAGWNVIASFRKGAASEVFHTVPPDIFVSKLYRYLPDEGYSQPDSLDRGMGYWVKANADGILIFHPSPLDSCGVEPIHHGGRDYTTVRIGNQCWLKENLDIGVMIDPLQNAMDNGEIEKYCYDDDPSNCLAYGGLYQWNEAMQYDSTLGTQGICPPGWHFASNDDYQLLLWLTHWDPSSLLAVGQGYGTDTSGFSGMLGGLRTPAGAFELLTEVATFWKSNKGDFGDAGFFRIGGGGFSEGGRDRNYGFSVRCVLN